MLWVAFAAPVSGAVLNPSGFSRTLPITFSGYGKTTPLTKPPALPFVFLDSGVTNQPSRLYRVIVGP